MDFSNINQLTQPCLHTSGVYLDLAKAFVTVEHTIVIGKLMQIGIQDAMLDWFQSYLENREHQVVEIQGKKSSPRMLNIGVPQGGVLSAILFFIYINDLHQLPLKAKIIGYMRMTPPSSKVKRLT